MFLCQFFSVVVVVVVAFVLLVSVVGEVFAYKGKENDCFPVLKNTSALEKSVITLLCCLVVFYFFVFINVKIVCF